MEFPLTSILFHILITSHSIDFIIHLSWLIIKKLWFRQTSVFMYYTFQNVSLYRHRHTTCANAYTDVKPVLVIGRYFICELIYLPKPTCNPKINTCDFSAICKHMHVSSWGCTKRLLAFGFSSQIEQKSFSQSTQHHAVHGFALCMGDITSGNGPLRSGLMYYL